MEIPLEGNIRDTSLAGLLAYLNRHRKTGTLLMKTPVFTKKVYLVKGDAIFASSTYEEDRLGEMLIKAGKITMEQYDESVVLLKKSGKRQGAILVELGYLSPKDLFWGVKYQVREIIYSLFHLEDAGYEFIEGDIPANEVITLKIDMGNLINEGVRRIDNWTRIRKEMPAAESTLRLSTDPATLFQDIELAPLDRKMLAMIDGKKTIKELIDSSWIGSFEAMRILYVLRSIGVIEEKKKVVEEVREKEEEVEETISLEDILQPVSEDEEEFRRKVDDMYMNLDNMSDHELLDADESTDQETIKKNYYRLSREFHPDRYYSSADPSLKDKLTAIFDAITRAYSLLKDTGKEKGFKEKAISGKKHVIDELMNAQHAEEQFKRGIEEFKKDNFWGAVESLKGAIKLEPGNAKYRSYLSLAYSRIPNYMKEAEESLLEALKLEPENVDYYVNLGVIYLKSGMKKKAQSQFEKALKLDPHNVKAKKGLEKTRG